jgi:acyl transferase domain-containing protein
MKDSDIAVIGLAGRFPGAADAASFWDDLRAGRVGIRFLSDQELAAVGVPPDLLERPDYVKASGVLAGSELFDAGLFGLSPREAEITDPQLRLFLECALAALENAGHAAGGAPGLTGVYAGSSFSSYLGNLLSHPTLAATFGFTRLLLGNDKDFLATWTSYKLNLRGPSLAVQTACSTSLVAVHLACQALANGECDLALAGGVAVRAQQGSGYLYREGDILSPDGHCRPFDAQAGGTVSGNGVGIVVLRRLADALDEGDTVRAIIKGTAVNNDGSLKVGFTAPAVDGQARAISEAIAVAEVDPDSIDYIEAHGTATALGDPVEVAALRQAFGRRSRPCWLGAVKANIGHLDAAAGVTGLIKTILALEHGEIPPTPHFRSPNPQIDFGPFRVVSELTPWPAGGHPRRAGVSSFGIGGTNAHVVLEEAPEPEPSGPARAWQILPLAARTAGALEDVAADLGRHLAARPGLSPAGFADVAYTLQVGRRALQHRRVVVCRDAAEAVAALAGGNPERPERVTSAVSDLRHRPVFFLFPGQGAQHVGMTAELYASEPGFRRRVDASAEILRGILGLDLRRILYPVAAERAAAELRLRETAITQPALFVVEHALAELWMEWGVRPRGMLGHSLGEYVAACLAGVLTLPDALRLVAARGRIMGEMPPGAMLSVARPADEIAALLGGIPGELIGGEIALAAINAADRCTVSGPVAAVEELGRRLAEQGIESRPLRTSHAFHSPLMEPAVERFAREVAAVPRKAPKLRYLSNLTGTWVGAAEVAEPLFWARQLREPVRFAAGIGELLREEAPILLEVGPGAALTGFARRQLGSAPGALAFTSLPRAEEPAAEVQTLVATAGRLWLHGVEIDWRGFHAEERRRRVPLPTYPFERRRYWIDPAAAGATAMPAMPPAAAAGNLELASRLEGGHGGEAEPAPEGFHPRPEGLATVYAEPAGEAEARLAELWRELLGIHRVGRHDNFFELGGDSLLAAQLLSRIRSEMGSDVALRTLFEAPSLAALAVETDRRRAPDGSRSPSIADFRQDRGSPPPLSFAQERFWAGRQAEAETEAPNTLPTLVLLDGALDLACLRRAVREIVDRHEVLRTSFREDAAGPVQVVHQAIAIEIPVVDLERLAPADRMPEARRWSALDVRAHFDYERVPLFRLTLYRCSERENLLLLTIHHIAFDGWSQAVLAAELSAVYAALRAGLPSPLPPLAAQYQDFARWQRHTLAGEALASQVAFWREHLAGASSLDLGAGRPRPGHRSFKAGFAAIEVPAELERKLEAFAAEHGVTLFITLFAAFNALLYLESREDDIVVICLFANRNQAEIENLIGSFYAGLPLRTRFSGAGSFRELLERVREVTLAAHEHPDILYEQVFAGMGFEDEEDRGGLETFRVLFQLTRVPVAGKGGSDDLRMTRLPIANETIRKDLSLFLSQSDRLTGRFKYNRDVLDAERVVRLRERFLRILATVVADPARPLDELLRESA